MTVISDAPQAAAHDSALELLSGMAVALGHDVDADFLLAELASGVRRTLDADRVSVLLLDDEGRLTPELAVARQHNDDLWQRFRTMPPIELDALPGARQALARGQVLLIDDASTSPLIPTAWQRTFALSSLAVAPLLADDAPAGLLAVEYPFTATPLPTTQLSFLSGMAGLAAIALSARRRRSQAERIDNVSAAVRALGAVHTVRAVAEHALAAMLDAAGVGHGLFARIDEDTVEVVAARGPELPEPGRYAITLLPTELVATCRDTWSSDPRALVSADVRGTSFTVLPVSCAGRPRAFVALPVVATTLPYDVTAELLLLADAAATAWQAVRAADDLDWHQRALAALPSLAPAAAVSAVDAIRALLVDAGLESPHVVVDRAVARATGLSPAAADVTRLLTRWRRTEKPAQAALSGETATPLITDGRVVGALLSRTPVPAAAAAHRLVTAMADVVGGALARQRIEELETAAAESAAHAAIATRAYREAGQILGLLSNSLHAGAAESPRAAGAEALVGQVRRLLRDATEVLAPSTARQADLLLAVTALAKQISTHGGPQTVVRRTGRTPALDVAVQVAVLRAAQRALALLRELRAVAATVVIESVDGEVVVTIAADELLAAAADGRGLLPALRDIRAWLAPVGASSEISYDDPHRGLVVRAPAGGHQPAHTAQRGESTTARL